MAGLIDRFICRREGHQPTVTLPKGSALITSYFTTCARCGKWIEVKGEAA